MRADVSHLASIQCAGARGIVASLLSSAMASAARDSRRRLNLFARVRSHAHSLERQVRDLLLTETRATVCSARGFNLPLRRAGAHKHSHTD